MTGVGDDSRGRFPGAPALVVGVTLAAGATLALVFTEDLRWLRLAIVAALWAALIGAFVAVRYRKQAAANEESVAQAQAVYELELEREIAARREFELEVEAETRERVEADSREELEALRHEVTALRESLESLFGGEVLYERVALTAQSTRMRSLKDEPKVVGAGEANGKAKAQLTSGTPAKPVERRTEMMAKVGEEDPEYGMARRPPPKPRKPHEPHQPQPQQSQKPPQKSGQSPLPPQPPPRGAKVQQVPRAPRPVDSGPPTRRVTLNDPAGSDPATAAKAASEMRAEPDRGQQPDDGTVAGMRPVRPQPAPQPPRRATPPQAGQRRPQPPRPPAPQRRQPEPARQQPDQRHTPGRQREPEQHDLTRPAMDRISRGRPAGGVVPPVRPESREPEPAPEPKPEFDFGWMSAWTDENRGHEADNADNGDNVSNAIDATGGDSGESTGRHGSNGQNGHGTREPEPVPEAAPPPEVPEPNPTLPESVRELQRSSRPGGRRRRDDGEDEAAQPIDAHSGGGSRHGAGTGRGRRRRAESEQAPDSLRGSGGSHSLDDAEADGASGSHNDRNDRNGGNGRNGHSGRPEQESGSHAEGRSVSDLLAAHGSATATPRRRRRAED